MTQCIICHSSESAPSIEHIVPRSLGNIHYILPRGKVCMTCNQRFAKYENAVLSSPLWVREKNKDITHNKKDAINSVVPTAIQNERLLLKMCFESMYWSRPKKFNSLNIDHVREELCGIRNGPFEIHFQKKLRNAKSIPRIINRWRLSNNGISLRYRIEDSILWFEFRYKSISQVIKINLPSDDK